MLNYKLNLWWLLFSYFKNNQALKYQANALKPTSGKFQMVELLTEITLFLSSSSNKLNSF